MICLKSPEQKTYSSFKMNYSDSHSPVLPILQIIRDNLSQDQIRVIYIDVLEGEIKPVHQKYSCLSPTEYQYENVPNDFEAVITVDENGFVVDYPSLFVRTAKLSTHYSS